MFDVVLKRVIFAFIFHVTQSHSHVHRTHFWVRSMPDVFGRNSFVFTRLKTFEYFEFADSNLFFRTHAGCPVFYINSYTFFTLDSKNSKNSKIFQKVFRWKFSRLQKYIKMKLNWDLSILSTAIIGDITQNHTPSSRPSTRKRPNITISFEIICQQPNYRRRDLRSRLIHTHTSINTKRYSFHSILKSYSHVHEPNKQRFCYRIYRLMRRPGGSSHSQARSPVGAVVPSVSE